jgi:hypothetical protein
MELLQDPFWQVLGVIATIVLGILALVFPFVLRDRKALTYETLSNTQFVTVDHRVASRTQVLFDGHSVSDVRVIVLKVYNSGTLPILPQDFVEQVAIDFGPNAQIMSAASYKEGQQSVDAQVRVEGGRVTIEPLLLNAGDTVDLSVSLTRFKELTFTGRIVGVNRIARRLYGRKDTLGMPRPVFFAVPWLIGLWLVILVLSAIFHDPILKQVSYYVLYGTAGMIWFFALLAIVRARVQLWRRRRSARRAAGAATK